MSAAYWSAGALERKLIKSDLESNGKIKRKRFLSHNIQSCSKKKGLNIKEVEISPSTSVTSSCDENSTQATRSKAAKSKNLTSILVGLAQKPEGMAIERTVRTFYRSRKWFNIIFTKPKANIFRA